jgi:DNA-binding LacI/PurR family transcriptional regulator
VETFDYEEYAEKVEQALVQMLNLAEPPTVIYTGYDTEAELIYLILTKLGIKVPYEISVLGFGGAQRDRPILQQLTSITVDEAEIGRRAAKFLNEMRVGERDIENGETVSMPLSISNGKTLTKLKIT